MRKNFARYAAAVGILMTFVLLAVRPAIGQTRTADKNWWLVTAASIASNVADVENTQFCLRHGCREVNPLQGGHPSRLRAYGVTLPITGLMTYLSYKWKRQDDYDRAVLGRTAKVRWYVPQVVNLGIHGFGLAFTFASTGR
jgi:hypothetical protein